MKSCLDANFLGGSCPNRFFLQVCNGSFSIICVVGFSTEEEYPLCEVLNSIILTRAHPFTSLD